MLVVQRGINNERCCDSFSRCHNCHFDNAVPNYAHYTKTRTKVDFQCKLLLSYAFQFFMARSKNVLVVGKAQGTEARLDGDTMARSLVQGTASQKQASRAAKLVS